MIPYLKGQLFVKKKEDHIMLAGSVAFIPGWIMLFIVILTIVMLFPNLFPSTNNQAISPALLAFIIGSLIPAFDDLLAFVFGKLFAHHSIFHSFTGVLIIYVFSLILSTPEIAKYFLLGGLFHLFFNYYLDYTTLFFPFTYREYGLTDLTKISTYGLKVIHYPIIILLFCFAIFKYFFILKTPIS